MTVVEHLIPAGDLIAHEPTDLDCPCGPDAEPDGPGWLLVHHRLDGRPA